MNSIDYNKKAWDRCVERGNPWTVPVDASQVAEARKGRAILLLTPHIAVPSAWLGAVKDKTVLCLACGGGQQGPLLAAMGAETTVFDNSPAQLEQDRFVAAREGLNIRLYQGNMQDLSCFCDASFDLIFHPVSNCFVDDILPVWREAWRVLKPGGRLLSGFASPVMYMFDFSLWEKEKRLVAAYNIPYADSTHLSPEELEERLASGEPLEFGHSFEDQLGGQMKSGFLLAAMYEDRSGNPVLDRYIPGYMATLAFKPPLSAEDNLYSLLPVA